MNLLQSLKKVIETILTFAINCIAHQIGRSCGRAFEK